MNIVGLHVVGITFSTDEVQHDFISSIEEGSFSAAHLSIKPCPDNPHDENAIAVLFDNEQLGYINAVSAANVSRLINTRNFTTYTVSSAQIFQKQGNIGMWIDINLSA